MKTANLIAVTLLFSGLSGRAEVDPASFRVHRPVADTVDSRSLAAVEADLSIWEGVKGYLETARLVDGDGNPVAYLPRRETESETVTRRMHLDTQVNGMERLPDNEISFTVEVDPDGGQVDGLDLDIPMQNFERTLSVAGLTASGEETPLVAEALVYDYTRYLDLRQTRIALPEHSFTRFRVRVEQADRETPTPYRKWAQTLENGEPVQRREWQTLVSRPLRIDQVKAFDRREEIVPGQPKQKTYAGLKWRAVETDREDLTVLEIDTRHAPVSSLTLKAADSVYSREVEVRVPVGDGWGTVERGRLSRIVYRDTRKENTEIRFDARREPRLRLVIYDHGNPPLKVEELAASGPVWRLVFLAESAAEYRLLYGAAEPERAEYDTHSIRELLREGHRPQLLALGGPTVHEPAGAGMAGVLSSRILLYVAVLVMAGMIGIGLWRAARTME